MTAKAAGQRFVAVLGAVVLLGAACGQEDSGLPDPPSTDRPELSQPVAPELTDEEQAAVDEVTALVDEFLALYQEILIEGESPAQSGFEELPPITGYLLNDAWDEVDRNARNGWRGDGAVAWEVAAVVDVDLENLANLGTGEETVPLVAVSYCVDATEWQVVASDSSTVSVPETPQLFRSGSRHTSVVQAVHYDPSPVEPRDDPQWWLDEWAHDGDSSC